MTSLRPRTTVAALLMLAASLSACANGPTSPFDTDVVNADADSAKRVPTLPWANSQAVPTLPWASATAVPTLPWATVQAVPTLPWASVRSAAPASSH